MNNNKQDSASDKSMSISSSSRERNNETLNRQILLEHNDGLHELMNNFNLSTLSQASGRLPVLMPRLQGEEPLNTADLMMRIIDTVLAILNEDSLYGDLPSNDDSKQGPQDGSSSPSD